MELVPKEVVATCLGGGALFSMVAWSLAPFMAGVVILSLVTLLSIFYDIFRIPVGTSNGDSSAVIDETNQ